LEADFKNNVEKIDGANGDIIRTLEKNFPAAYRQTTAFSKRFDAPTIEEVAENVWNFLKENVKYEADGSDHQKIRLPARLLADKSGDCKSFALFAASVLAHYTETGFRYSSYRNDPTPTHVYAIAKDEDGKTIIIDAVWHSFNDEKDFKHHKDHWMKISTLSGTDEKIIPQIAVDEYTYHALASWEKILKDAPKGSGDYKEATKHVNELLANIGLDKKGIARAQSMAGIGKHHWWQKFEDKVHSALKGAWNGAKHLNPAFSSMRNAYLALLDINYRGHASRIVEQLAKDPEPLKQMWHNKFGGNFDRLVNAAKRGAKHKPFLGRPKRIKGFEEPIGNPAAIAAIIASAAPLLLAIGKLIPKGKADADTPVTDPNAPGYDPKADPTSPSYDSVYAAMKEDATPETSPEIPSDTTKPLSLFQTILKDGTSVVKEVAQLVNPQDASGATNHEDITQPKTESSMGGVVGIVLIGGVAATYFFSKKKH